jgi:hypothetical protein
LTARQLRLHVAQRNRQRRIGFPLDDAEARSELRERGRDVGLHRQRKALLIGELASGIVAHVGRHLELELRLLRKRSSEAHFLHEVAVLSRIRQRRLIRLALRVAQHNARRHRTRHRCGQRQAHRQERQAVGVAIHALAGKCRGERGANLELQRLIRGSLHAAERGNAFTPDQSQRRIARQTPGTSQEQNRKFGLVRLLELLRARTTKQIALRDRRQASVLVQRAEIAIDKIAPLLEQLKALLAGHHPHRYLFGNTTCVAVGVLHYRLRVDGRVEPEDEDLLFIDDVLAAR